MATMDINDYRDQFLKVVEEHMMAKKESIANFTTENLHRAIMTEMNRADEETWEVELLDDRDAELKVVEDRIEKFFETHKDYGVGNTF